jgi:hypothetical protein
MSISPPAYNTPKKKGKNKNKKQLSLKDIMDKENSKSVRSLLLLGHACVNSTPLVRDFHVKNDGMYIYVYTYVYMYMYIYICIYINLYMFTNSYICIYFKIYMYIYVHTYQYIYIYVYVHM